MVTGLLVMAIHHDKRCVCVWYDGQNMARAVKWAVCCVQVDALLRGLGVEPSKLPARAHDMHAAVPAFEAAWAGSRHPPPGVAAHHAAAAAAHHAASSAAARAAGGAWAAEFDARDGGTWTQQFTAPLRDALPDMTRHHAAHAPAAAWAREFSATAKSTPGIAWAEQYLSGGGAGAGATGPVETANAWVDEFSQRAAAREGALAGVPEGEAAQAHSRRLADVLQDDPEGKFKGSQFLQFLSKMSQGEVDFQAGKVTQEGPVAAGSWAHEFTSVDPATREAGIAARRGISTAAVPSARGVGAAMEERWAEEFTASARAEADKKAADAAFAEAWATQFEREGVDEWVKDFQGMQARMVLPT